MKSLCNTSTSTRLTRNKRATIFTAVFIHSLIPATAVSADNTLKLSTGFDYSSGSYGLSSDTEISYIPFSAKYENFPWNVKLTIPYVRITGPSGVVASTEGVVIVGTDQSARTTAEGLGDIVVSTGYALDSLFDSSLFVDLTAKAKIATADASKGLGTGENDYSLQLDIAKSYEDWTPFATIGHKIIGDPSGINLNNINYSSVGMDRKISSALSSGISYDVKEASSSRSENAKEGLIYLNWKASSKTSMMAYGIAGFSDGSPNNGLGIQWSVKY